MVSKLEKKYNKRHIKYDILSGFIVSLIALPLCLGIAAASNFPPITGVLTSIIGGLIVGYFSGSELAIKGPAAGLIVIVAGAVEEFGRGNMQEGYLLTASLIAVTGLVQIVLGLAKIGKWADFIPSSVIHGMLAAIGIIIMSKQIHFLIGILPSEIKGMRPIALIKHIPQSIMHLEWHIALIGFTSLLLLIILPRIKNRALQTIPSFLIVILVSIFMAQLFQYYGDKKINNSLINPGQLSFHVWFNTSIFSSENLSITIKYFFLLSIIGTIESMLTVKAVDLLDPYKRSSNYNKDVIAIGLGNLLAGLVGALPMISEVARSSANINNKGVSRLSGIMHGAFLLIFVLIFVSVIKLIPIAALSSILIFVGFKLAHPKSFIHAFKVSNEHLLVFLTTTIVTLLEDLLLGVVCGIALKIVINMIKSGEVGKLFKSNILVSENGNNLAVQLDSAAVFTNWLPVKGLLEKQTQNKKIVIDFTQVKIVDTSFIENLSRFKENYQGEIVYKNYNELKGVKKDPFSMRVKSDGMEVITIQLSDYEKRMKAFCEENNYIISFRTMMPISYLSNFKGFKHSDIKQTALYIMGTKNGVKFEYFESTVYDSVNMFEYHVNVLGVEFGTKPVPRFLMQKETKLETVFEFLLKNQIVFKNHPFFNSRYSVYSSQKDLAFSLFSDELIEHFENREIKDKVIEGDGKNKVIIYTNGKCFDTESFENKLELGIKIHDLSNHVGEKAINS